MFKRIHPYLHEYDFPYHDYIKEFKSEILEAYEVQKHQATSYDIEIHNPVLEKFLIEKLLKITHKNYIVGERRIECGIRAYIQNNEYYMSKFHNHAAVPGNICCVFYIDIPKVGGELEFHFGEYKVKIKPEKDKIYFFPIWAYHKPLPQEDEETRICFNWSYGGNIRPINLITSEPW